MSNEPDVCTFLASELKQLGFTAAELPSASSAGGEWHVERDGFGMTVTASRSLNAALEAFLATALGAPRFTSDAQGPCIFRRDDLGVTIMLIAEDHEVKVIVLVWKDHDIYATMQSLVQDALKDVARQALEECTASLDEAASADDADKEAKFDEAVRRLSEVVEAIDRCGDGHTPDR